MEYFQILIADNFISPLCVAALIRGTISDQACNKTFFISMLEINSSCWNPFNNTEMQYNERLHKFVLCIFLIISVTCSETTHTKADACAIWGDITAIRVGHVTVQAVSYWPRTTKVQSQANLWWAEWQWDKFISQYFSSPLSVSFPHCSMLPHLFFAIPIQSQQLTVLFNSTLKKQ